MTTTNKCEHWDWDEDAGFVSHIDVDKDGNNVRCKDCGQRFIPSDVLEGFAREARGILDAYGTFDGNSHMRMSDELHHALARIDAVLGKK